MYEDITIRSFGTREQVLEKIIVPGSCKVHPLHLVYLDPRHLISTLEADIQVFGRTTSRRDGERRGRQARKPQEVTPPRNASAGAN